MQARWLDIQAAIIRRSFRPKVDEQQMAQTVDPIDQVYVPDLDS